jgi:hypothetical protein
MSMTKRRCRRRARAPYRAAARRALEVAPRGRQPGERLEALCQPRAVPGVAAHEQPLDEQAVRALVLARSPGEHAEQRQHRRHGPTVAQRAPGLEALLKEGAGLRIIAAVDRHGAEPRERLPDHRSDRRARPCEQSPGVIFNLDVN